MAQDSELSIEETNKIRLSLGLKPLKVDTGPAATPGGEPIYEDTTEGRERRAVDNWKAHEAEIEKEAARKRRQDEIKRAREQAQRFRKLEGKGLADEDDEEDAKDWVKKMKKRQKKKADEIAREMEEELEREARERKEYTSAELQGLKVSHDLADLGDLGGETILTLKDTTIEENEEEGDELISTDLVERERLAERLELKKKKPAYNVYDDEDETGEKRLLAQYDDEEDKARLKKRFVLDGTGSLAGNETYRQEVAAKLKQTALSLDIQSEIPSDYVDPASVKVKKPKKTKKKSTRRRADDDEDAITFDAAPPAPPADENAMELEDDLPVAPKPKRKIAEDVNFIDDDDLQASLALKRRTALKKRKLMKPADIARQLREETEAVSTPGAMDEDEEEPGLVIDETSEFVATLRAPTASERKPKPEVSEAPVQTSPEAKEEDPEAMEEDGDINMIMDERSTSPKLEEPTVPAITSTGLEEETTISRGIGATLAMLNQRGLLKRDPEAEAKAQLIRDRDRFRAQKRLHEIEAEEKAKAARLKDRQSGKFERMSAREREDHARWENKQRDLQEAREMAARFKDYKPDVNLSYKDEFGREMNQKEAFKYLSHQFHGKGSGKAKTEKRLKKIEDEKKREAAGGLGSAADNAVSAAAKKSKQAGVRLM
ncbi:Similar to U4/U6.U5 tri-snRNP-associated protein snu66; acc. no. O94538 [Pyronema omphalodes CBS 100304]|uniref:Similar to U4/U6.U5 tri-snRNP-associated protein snu66 acc. no. O94538 n=1 Tax=Pyronema omphalodes (strain CBS 100304) TaxID=1076935 RepID=U4L216_PYROM|nr:Similar to U4/U6.U5 tri-snRNP-associated protein snu66; acc. no. O94538 [Pyronema omphalodes CBS 100304]